LDELGCAIVRWAVKGSMCKGVCSQTLKNSLFKFNTLPIIQ